MPARAQEQRELLASCKAALEALLDERTNAEQAAADAYAASLSGYQQQLDASHSSDQDAYHALRMRCAALNPAPCMPTGAACQSTVGLEVSPLPCKHEGGHAC